MISAVKNFLRDESGFVTIESLVVIGGSVWMSGVVLTDIATVTMNVANTSHSRLEYNSVVAEVLQEYGPEHELIAGVVSEEEDDDDESTFETGGDSGSGSDSGSEDDQTDGTDTAENDDDSGSEAESGAEDEVDCVGNPGNDKCVGNAGETPNGDDDWGSGSNGMSDSGSSSGNSGNSNPGNSGNAPGKNK